MAGAILVFPLQSDVRIRLAEPLMSVLIVPKSKADAVRLADGLAVLSIRDPTFRFTTDRDAIATTVLGMGELHLDVIVDRLKRDFKVDADVGKSQVIYLATIRKKARAEYKYDRQSSGRDVYAQVALELEPLAPGGGFEFVDDSKGRIPEGYIPVIKESARDACGLLADFQIVDIKVTLTGGSSRPASNAVAFCGHQSHFDGRILPARLQCGRIPTKHHGSDAHRMQGCRTDPP